MEKYNFAESFSKNPGLRFKKLSEDSGEEFRDNVLERYFQSNTPVLINVDGVESALGASFLSEAFGNIAVKYGIEKFNKLIHIDTTSVKGKITNDEMLKRVKEALERAAK
ncbi:STAS-like domain-containing protein [Aliarcobacter butzleri]|uniref:STAS-like domain-containing protein n=1 Tax=Aliarcobacter butzleri TaxID=28197 RepID=UPI003B20D652